MIDTYDLPIGTEVEYRPPGSHGRVHYGVISVGGDGTYFRVHYHDDTGSLANKYYSYRRTHDAHLFTLPITNPYDLDLIT